MTGTRFWSLGMRSEELPSAEDAGRGRLGGGFQKLMGRVGGGRWSFCWSSVVRRVFVVVLGCHCYRMS